MEPTASPAPAGLPVAEQVAAQLRRDLLNGTFRPGQRMREEELAARFECGRHTIRAVIKTLADSRLLVHERNRGATVPALTRERIDEAFEFRAVIEGGALQLALQHGADFREVERAVDDLAALPDDVEWLDLTQAHGRIHSEIVAASGNSRLISAYAGCRDELRLMFVALQPTFTVRRFAELHRELVDQLKHGGEDAVRALNADLEGDGYRALLAQLEGSQDS